MKTDWQYCAWCYGPGFEVETTRRFAHHGYLAICANLYERAGQGNPDDVAAKVRGEGGIADAQMVGQIVIGPIFRVLQEQDFAVVVSKLPQCLPHQLPPFARQQPVHRIRG